MINKNKKEQLIVELSNFIQLYKILLKKPLKYFEYVNGETHREIYLGEKNKYKNILEFWLTCVIQMHHDYDSHDKIYEILTNSLCLSMTNSDFMTFVTDLCKNESCMELEINQSEISQSIKMFDEWNDMAVIWEEKYYGAFFWFTTG